jgi:hypothetical protein
VRCVRRDQTEICTGTREFTDSFEQVSRHAAQIIRVHEIKAFPEINADDNKFRIMPIAGALSIQGYDSLVIIECAFRPKAADDSEGLHLVITNLVSIKLWRDMPRFLLFLSPTNS